MKIRICACMNSLNIYIIRMEHSGRKKYHKAVCSKSLCKNARHINFKAQRLSELAHINCIWKHKRTRWPMKKITHALVQSTRRARIMPLSCNKLELNMVQGRAMCSFQAGRGSSSMRARCTYAIHGIFSLLYSHSFSLSAPAHGEKNEWWISEVWVQCCKAIMRIGQWEWIKSTTYINITRLKVLSTPPLLNQSRKRRG